MTPDQWQRVRVLFELALEQEQSDTAEWLAREAHDDPALRAEVQSLLDHHSRAGAFLDAPVAVPVPWLLDEPDGLMPGAMVGSYTIVREIGRGGMGRVYLASDARLGRTVALKALAPALTRDPMHRERLRREARAAAALTHPGICTVYALEEVDDSLYIATEFVDGHTLRQEIAGGPPPSTALLTATVTELAAALASAHNKGVTHRDLKPENVMRTADGRVKVLDFGLARFDAPGLSPAAMYATQPGAVMGTPAYMAPEQLNAQPVDARADVFAFGVTAYEFASGAHPFAAPTELALVARVLESRAEPLAVRCPEVPLSIAAVIDRCLQKPPAERFGSASEIVAALATGAIHPQGSDPRLTPGYSGYMTLGSDPRLTPGYSGYRWWRTHQLSMMAMYIVATTIAWQIKDSFAGPASLWIFVGVGIGSAISGITRAHLLFTERMNRRRLADEQRRTAGLVTAVDLVLAVALFAVGLLFAPSRPLYAMLTMALALGIALAALIMEPATTAATFGGDTT
jgi:serine/threonine protein kinase